MTTKIARLTPQNAGYLGHVDSEIFDGEIDTESVAAFVGNGVRRQIV